MRLHLSQIAVITNVVADPVLINVLGLHTSASDRFDHLEGLLNRTRVILATAEIVDFRDSRRFVELVHETRYIFGVNVVPDLFTFVSVNFVLTTLQVALDQIAEKPMEFDSGMVRAGQATSA